MPEATFVGALITLIENLASSPQLLVLLLLEGTRIIVAARRPFPSKLPHTEMSRYEFWLQVVKAILNAAPSIGLVASIFFVRF